METRMTLEQLEKMKTHEIADQLANVVLLLRRLPDVPCAQLIQQAPDSERKHEQVERTVPIPATAALPSLTREELAKKKVAELKILAKELNVLFSSTTKKDDLINKILARAANGHSEQRAMLDL
ncbi:MAG TPA: Rho termination factor N-terminal domain-containing protein [Ktedonobacteraceae bacterium]|nr:Rho termination factor N-terminal domain-containing protein [Ktedonobacteraceae bacterium]